MSEPLGEFMNRSLLCTRACFAIAKKTPSVSVDKILLIRLCSMLSDKCWQCKSLESVPVNYILYAILPNCHTSLRPPLDQVVKNQNHQCETLPMYHFSNG